MIMLGKGDGSPWEYLEIKTHILNGRLLFLRRFEKLFRSKSIFNQIHNWWMDKENFREELASSMTKSYRYERQIPIGY